MKKRWVKLKIFKKYLPTTQKDALKKKTKTTTIIFIFLLNTSQKWYFKEYWTKNKYIISHCGNVFIFNWGIIMLLPSQNSSFINNYK